MEEPGSLPDETRVVYVSPLKALSNDIQQNLEEPLAGIRAELSAQGLPDVAIRTVVRTGDTPSAERTAMTKQAAAHPGHDARVALHPADQRRGPADARHGAHGDRRRDPRRGRRQARLAPGAVARAAGGSRARSMAAASPRIGLSATQRPIEEVARFLVGAGGRRRSSRSCAIVDVGHRRRLDLGVEVPASSPLEAVMSNEVWEEVYDRIAELVRAHRTTLVFVNTRRLAERATRHLAERLGEERVASHHGSLSKRAAARGRAAPEGRRARGAGRHRLARAGDRHRRRRPRLPDRLDALDRHASCSASAAPGHRLGGLPKGRLFPLDARRAGRVRGAARRGAARRARPADHPRAAARHPGAADRRRWWRAEEWSEDELFELVRRAWPYRDLTREDFDEVVAHARRGLHHPARAGAAPTSTTTRSTAGCAAGAARASRRSPRAARSRTPPTTRGARARRHGHRHAQRGLRDREHGRRHLPARQRLVADPPRRAGAGAGRGRARRQPPTIPFWLGEAPARSAELSQAVSRLRRRSRRAAAAGGGPAGVAARRNGCGRAVGLPARPPPSRSSSTSAAGRAALGAMPTQETLVARALLRRGRRHAARAARAVRQPDQPRLGPGAAQALLPQLQLRAAGRGDRGRDRALARADAQLPARGRVPLPPLAHRARAC